MTDFKEMMSELLQKHLKFINENKEKLVQAWVAQHGWNPDECQLIQQTTLQGWRLWVERRGEFDELQQFRAREPFVQALLRMAEVAVGQADKMPDGAHRIDSSDHRALSLATRPVRDFKIGGAHLQQSKDVAEITGKSRG